MPVTGFRPTSSGMPSGSIFGNFAYPVRYQSRSRVRPVAAVEFFIRGG